MLFFTGDSAMKLKVCFMVWALVFISNSFSSKPKIQFEIQTIDDAIPGAYQVTVADVNHDGKPDVAGLSSKAGVFWYKNPTWEKYPISTVQTKNNIDLAFHDLDDDGELELALAYNFDLNNSSIGSIGWLDRTEDLNQPWTLHHIHDEVTSHRLRWGDINGDGQKEIIVVPIAGKGSKAPEYNQYPARQTVLYPPKNPAKQKWKIDLFDEAMHITHGMFVWRHPNKKTDSILIAGVEGVIQFDYNGSQWKHQKIGSGAPPSDGMPGSSEIVVGQFVDNRLFWATIEPWHGNQVVVYTKSNSNNKIERLVLDDTFNNGHALAAADFDKDGVDEIIACYRGKGYSIYLYDYDLSTKKMDTPDCR